MGLKKLFSLALFIFLTSTLSFSQAAQRIVPAIQNPAGGGNYAVLGPNASVYVCTYNAQLTCNSGNYTSIYKDVTLLSPITQPVVADSNGVYQYFISSGTQVVEKVCFSSSRCQSYPLYFSPSAGGTITGPLVADLERNGLHWYDVRAKGAECDGVYSGGAWTGTDDTAAFQTAFSGANISGSLVEIPSTYYDNSCLVQPGLSTASQAALTINANTFNILGTGPGNSVLQDETTTSTPVSNSPLLQIGPYTYADTQAYTDMRGFALHGANNVSYPKGVLAYYPNNLSSLSDVSISLSSGATNSYGLMNVIATPPTEDYNWGEMKFTNVSVYGPNISGSTGTGNTCIYFRAPAGNTNFVNSNVESCTTGVDFGGASGTPILTWTGGHTERIPPNGNAIFSPFGYSFKIQQATLQATGVDLDSGMVYLDSSTVNSNVDLSLGSTDGYIAPLVDNGVGNRIHAPAAQGDSAHGGLLNRQSLNFDGSEQYRTLSLTADPLFLNSGASGWSTSSSNVTVSNKAVTSPGAKAGQAVQCKSTDLTSYCYQTVTVTPSAEYELTVVGYFTVASTAFQLSVYDAQSSTTIYTAAVQPTMTLPLFASDSAYRVFRTWIPASASATTWLIQIQPSLTKASAPAIITYLGLNQSVIRMRNAVPYASGSGTATCTSATTYSTYLGATCALSGQSTGNAAQVSWVITPPYSIGSFFHLVVTTDANSVVPICTMGSLSFYLPPNTTQEYNIPLGYTPTSITCFDPAGLVTDPNDMVVSQATVVQIPSATVTPILTPTDGLSVLGITPDGSQQRGYAFDPKTTAGCFPSSGLGVAGAGTYLQTCNIPFTLAAQTKTTATVTMDTVHFPQFSGTHYIADQVTCQISISEQNSNREMGSYYVFGYSSSAASMRLEQVFSDTTAANGPYVILGNLQAVNSDNIWSFDISNYPSYGSTQNGMLSIVCSNYFGYTVQSITTSIPVAATTITPTWFVLPPAAGGTGEGGTITGALYGNGASAITAETAAQAVAVIGSTPVATATALAATPTLCPTGQAPTGVLANGNATGCASLAGSTTSTPLWLQYLGNGSGGSNTTASGSMLGDYYYTNFTVPYGNTVTTSGSGLVIHATGTCTIAGTINAYGSAPGLTYGGSSGGGGGGGAAAGAAAAAIYELPGSNDTAIAGGTAGAISGGAGGSGSTPGTGTWRSAWTNTNATDGLYMSGSNGGAGGSSGGAGGNAGSVVVMICNSITGTDGTHTGTINVSGQAGTASAANNTGGGGGGGGGAVILSSQSAVGTWPTITTTGGAAGTCGAFTGCGAGGTGGAGWYAEFAGW